MEKALKDILVKQAKEKGMCLPNFRPLLESDDKGELIDLYKRTIDWALENQYPTLDILAKYFGDCEKYGVYVGKRFNGEVLDSHYIYVFHNCTGRVNVAMNLTAQLIPMLYFANVCDMTVGCKQENAEPIRVPLYIFGESKVKTTNHENAQFPTYRMELM